MEDFFQPTVTLTSRISEQIEIVLKKSDVERRLVRELEQYRENENIPFRLVKEMHDILSTSGEKKQYLHELMRDSELCLPKPEVVPRNPELEARCKRLRAEQENRIYRSMTKNVDKSEKDYFRPGEDLKEINRQIVSVFNFIITVGGAFAFGYKATEYGFEGVSNAFALQLIVGLSLATLVFFADLYFLVRESR